MEVKRIPSARHRRRTRVAAYVRVSTAGYRQEDSYETQAAFYEAAIEKNPEWDFAGIFGDKVSGTRTEGRESFQRMMNRAMAGQIDLILCKSFSRWARNLVDGLRTVKMLTGSGVHILFAQEGIDTRKPGNVLQISMAAAIAQKESESVSENLKWIYRQKAERGIFVAARNRYFGFDTGDGQFHPDGNAEYVRRIYRLFLEGESMAGIAAGLNREGIKTLRGKAWSGVAVRRILTNEVYAGDVRFQKTPARNIITGMKDAVQAERYIRDHHEGIVSRSEWERAQQRVGR